MPGDEQSDAGRRVLGDRDGSPGVEARLRGGAAQVRSARGPWDPIGISVRASLRMEGRFFATGVRRSKAKVRAVRGAVGAYLVRLLYGLTRLGHSHIPDFLEKVLDTADSDRSNRVRSSISTAAQTNKTSFMGH